MINQILKQVKENKKYKTIADSVVKKEIQNYLKSKLPSRKNKGITKQDIKNLGYNSIKILILYFGIFFLVERDYFIASFGEWHRFLALSW